MVRVKEKTFRERRDILPVPSSPMGNLPCWIADIVYSG